ncbi:DoxX-like family protein [Paenibacillus sp. CAU 1782]
MGEKVYVESRINASLEKVWEYTQTPHLHERWDLRFSEISYLPKEREEDRQTFLYKTNIGFGISIAGEGESYGTREQGGIRTSTLKFGTNQRLSLIREGGGFWRYVPDGDGVIFLTQYDYRTRFGGMGKIFDRLAFRPLMGWATAWSFDALRLWLEKGIHPASSLYRFIRVLLIGVILCLLWCYQGLVPKLLVPDSGELELISQYSVFAGYEWYVLTGMGIAEIAFGLLFLYYRSRMLHYLNIILLAGLLLSGLASPAIYTAPFNPVTLNIAMMALSALYLLEREPVASARHCIRKPRD